jgi:hypothetical protein
LKDFPHMLVATRDHEPHADARHFAPPVPPRTMASRFTSGVQLLGSLIGIPLALIGGYSTYHANFSPEAKCQALRGNIVAMLDRKADASTLRMLVHRDVASFEHDCGAVDAEAAAAFKTLLTAEQPAHRAAPVKSAAAERPAKIEKVGKAEKREPPAKAEPVKKSQETVSAKEPAPAKDSARVDAAWLDSVRDVLRESSTRPLAAEAAPEPAASMPPPIVVPAQAAPANDTATAAVLPAAPDHPVPPASIPNTN